MAERDVLPQRLGLGRRPARLGDPWAFRQPFCNATISGYLALRWSDARGRGSVIYLAPRSRAALLALLPGEALDDALRAELAHARTHGGAGDHAS